MLDNTLFSNMHDWLLRKFFLVDKITIYDSVILWTITKRTWRKMVQIFRYIGIHCRIGYWHCHHNNHHHPNYIQHYCCLKRNIYVQRYSEILQIKIITIITIVVSLPLRTSTRALNSRIYTLAFIAELGVDVVSTAITTIKTASSIVVT